MFVGAKGNVSTCKSNDGSNVFKSAYKYAHLPCSLSDGRSLRTVFIFDTASRRGDDVT